MKLVIATRNAHKLEEIRAIFDFAGLDVGSAFDYPDMPDVVEDGDTFEANALKKAREIAGATGCWALADDSGLVVDALDGAPGIYSARYAGEHCSYADNNAKLLRELEGVEDRAARFVTVIALSDPSGVAQTVDGECPGVIIDQPRGARGFGYDPLFVPDGYDRTFAELDASVKNRIPHPGRALEQARRRWADTLRG